MRGYTGPYIFTKTKENITKKTISCEIVDFVKAHLCESCVSYFDRANHRWDRSPTPPLFITRELSGFYEKAGSVPVLFFFIYNTFTGDHNKYQVGPAVWTKTYVSAYFYSQDLVVFTITGDHSK